MTAKQIVQRVSDLRVVQSDRLERCTPKHGMLTVSAARRGPLGCSSIRGQLVKRSANYSDRRLTLEAE